ncbi:hypothetical protein DFH09DRAFT_589590 [Mycena vulgaris]|nr:hypothetical protein DFH09DRAFT_589590 [Mycena vulgaris]
MAGSLAQTIIVFGASPGSYYVGHGRHHFVENMSPFLTHASMALNISATRWISVSRNGDNWIDYNMTTEQFHFNGNIAQDIRNYLFGANGKFKAELVSFPDSPNPGHYFVKGEIKGSWSAVLPDYFIQRLSTMQHTMPNFNMNITGMLFGKGKTNICLFAGGFGADLDDSEVASPDHPLYKIFLEYSRPEDRWCIEPGSALCFYDSRFFFLKFKKPGEHTVRNHWNLPPDMAAKLAELQALAQQPTEQSALLLEQQMLMRRVQDRFIVQRRVLCMIPETEHEASLSRPGTILEKRYLARDSPGN